jgi:amino-acid N-acetyltransferase
VTADIFYRLATPDDVPRLIEMLEPFVRARKLLRRSPEEINVLTKHGFIAEGADAIVGFCAIEIYSRKLAEIQSLAVAEGFQGRGIGRHLVMQCLDRARELDVMEVLAISASDDFLRGCGFDYSLPDQKRALFCQLRGRGE